MWTSKDYHQMMLPAHSGVEGSVRLVLINNPTRSINCSRYTVSHLNGSRVSGRQLAWYRAPPSVDLVRQTTHLVVRLIGEMRKNNTAFTA